MTAELVHRDVASGVATITLDSPANRNALSAQLRRELVGHLDAAIADDAVRVIVLTHSGTVFCAGMDLTESRSASAARQGTAEVPRILETLWTSPKPVIARLTGPARAGGVGIVASCDVAVAAASATFAFSEVRIGVVPAMISVTVLSRLLPHAAVDAEVQRFVGMFRLGAPGALAATKELLRGLGAPPIADELAAMNDLSARYFAGEEGQEGIAAFAEKRPPSWATELAGRGS